MGDRQRIPQASRLALGAILLIATLSTALTSCSVETTEPEGPPDLVLSVVSGGYQPGEPGEQLAAPVVVRLSQSGAPIADAAVWFQIILGGGFGWALTRLFGRALWQREIDPDTDDLVADYLTFDVDFRPADNINVTGGAYYDLASGLWGTADAQATYMAPRGVGRASNSLAVRSENSRPKTQAMIKANNMEPAIAFA